MAAPRVLLIEDNVWDVELLRIALTEKLGHHHLDILQNGEAALAFVREHRSANLPSPDPCVIVLDLRLPQHDGLTVLEEVRRSPALDHIQVIVLSSFASLEERQQVAKLGGLFREKPNQLDGFEALADLIASVCRDGPLMARQTVP